MTLVGVFVPGLGNKELPGLLAAGVVKGVWLPVADGVNAEGNALTVGGKDWNGTGVQGAGVTPRGWEGCSWL